MEYREPPRIAAPERRLDGAVDDPNLRPRLRRFDFVRAQRRLDSPRLLIAIALAIAAVALTGYVVIQFSRTAIDWLLQQPQYQLGFADIQLQPAPPAWFRGGPKAFLKQVRENAKEAETLRVLELPKGAIDRDQIAIDFKKFPWVKEVPRIEYPPHAIRVHLVYRVPVALMHIRGSTDVYLDSEGYVLPAGDVDTKQLGPLIWIDGAGLDQASPENSAGLVWRSSAPGHAGARLETAIRSAARLAGFLQDPERLSEADKIPFLRTIRIVLPTDERGFWIENVRDKEHTMILWGESPGNESADGLKESEKWEILRKWAKNQGRALPAGSYWRFTESELLPVVIPPP